jgi:aminoglycoside 6-adenylyltransferase
MSRLSRRTIDGVMTNADQPSATPAALWTGADGLIALRSRLHAWALHEPRIHAAVAFGSTERTDRPADQWSDLDLLFVVDDQAAWLDDLSWTDAIGQSWIRLVSESPLPDVRVVQVLFVGGYDVDLIPIDREHLVALEAPDVSAELFGHGARVVIDRIGAFDALAPTTDTGSVSAGSGVSPPSAEEFEAVVGTFLYQTVWATKRLFRGERWRAHDDVDDYMRDRLLRMVEWHALAVGVEGVFPESRRLEVWVPPEVASQLPPTFARYDDLSIAQALVRGQALFRQLAREVAGRWGFAYPEAADLAIDHWVRDRLAESTLGDRMNQADSTT